MNNDKDYASDSDSSDEDFRPDENAEKLVSEESSDDEIDDEELEDNAEITKSKKGKRKGKSTKTKSNTTKKTVETKRITRHSKEAGKNVQETSSQDKEGIESDDDEKAHADALWADFLGDVKQSTSNDVKQSTSNDVKQSTSNDVKQSTSNDVKKVDEQKKKGIKVTTNGDTEKLEDKGKKLNCIDEATKEVTITEILDFAGEEIRVQKTVNADNVKENKTVKNQNSPGMSTSGPSPIAGFKRAALPASSSSGGLGSLLNQIGKKKKISVLEKTKLDWNTFKKDEGIEEELQTFNKGKDGFLERQDFLERTDLRQFEIERNLRQTRRKH